MRIGSFGAVAAIAALTIAGCDSARNFEEDRAGGCAGCHGFPPPPGLQGQTDPSDPHVGAHARHITGGQYSNAFTCGTCHTVPADLTHVDGTVQVNFVSDGQRQLPPSLGTYTRGTQTCAVYCHGSTLVGDGGQNTTPSWTQAAQLACNACHASRPTGPGLHTAIGAHAAAPCTFCHLGYVQDTTVDLALHVNGARDVVFTDKTGGTTSITTGWANCANCHGQNANHD